MQALIQSHRTSRVGRLGHFCNMDIVLTISILFSRGGKFRGRKISRNAIRSGYYFGGRKISRKIKIRENSENLLHAKNWCYTVLRLQIEFNEHHRVHIMKVSFKYPLSPFGFQLGK